MYQCYGRRPLNTMFLQSLMHCIPGYFVDLYRRAPPLITTISSLSRSLLRDI